MYLELYAAFAPAAATARLERMRTWLDTHQDQVIILVFLLLGFWLAGKSIYLLVSSIAIPNTGMKNSTPNNSPHHILHLPVRHQGQYGLPQSTSPTTRHTPPATGDPAGTQSKEPKDRRDQGPAAGKR